MTQIADDPQCERDAAMAGLYYGERFCAKLNIEGEGYEHEAVIWAVTWWRSHRGEVDLWTFMRRRLAELCGALHVYYVESPTNEQVAAGEHLGGSWEGNILHGVSLRHRKGKSARDKEALALLRCADA